MPRFSHIWLMPSLCEISRLCSNDLFGCVGATQSVKYWRVASASDCWSVVETVMLTPKPRSQPFAASHLLVGLMLVTSNFHSTIHSPRFSFFPLRDDQDVKDDWGEAAGADAPRTQTDASQLHEHRQRAASCSYIRCVCVTVCRGAGGWQCRSLSIQQLL